MYCEVNCGQLIGTFLFICCKSFRSFNNVTFVKLNNISPQDFRPTMLKFK